MAKTGQKRSFYLLQNQTVAEARFLWRRRLLHFSTGALLKFTVLPNEMSALDVVLRNPAPVSADPAFDSASASFPAKHLRPLGDIGGFLIPNELVSDSLTVQVLL
jgi:hypothetical protein